MTSSILPYHPLSKIVSHVYCVKGELDNIPIGRRMTVISLSGGELIIHSPIAMHEPDIKHLNTLGHISYLIAPNKHHVKDMGLYASYLPDAKVLVPSMFAKKLKKHFRVNGTIEEDWPDVLNTELKAIPLQGTRMGECAFVHLPSRTLILTDLVFNLKDNFSGLSKLILKMNNAFNHFGPSHLCRYYYIQDKHLLAASLKEIQKLDFDRIIMSHGDILEHGGKKKLTQAFAFLRLS